MLNRAAKWLALVACAGILAAGMWLGSPGDPGWWLAALIALLWQAGPILLAAACAHASPGRLGQGAFLALAVMLVLFAGYANWGVMTSSSSTAAVGLLFYSLYAYAAWMVVLTIAVIFGWEHRENWLKESSRT